MVFAVGGATTGVVPGSGVPPGNVPGAGTAPALPRTIVESFGFTEPLGVRERSTMP